MQICSLDDLIIIAGFEFCETSLIFEPTNHLWVLLGSRILTLRGLLVVVLKMFINFIMLEEPFCGFNFPHYMGFKTLLTT